MAYRWIPITRDQWRGQCFHLMTSSCFGNLLPGSRPAASEVTLTNMGAHIFVTYCKLNMTLSFLVTLPNRPPLFFKWMNVCRQRAPTIITMMTFHKKYSLHHWPCLRGICRSLVDSQRNSIAGSVIVYGVSVMDHWMKQSSEWNEAR